MTGIDKMKKIAFHLTIVAMLIMASASVDRGLRGQLTVINVPSTDTLQTRSFYIEFDALGKPGDASKGGFQSYGYRTVYGINRKTDAGVSFFYSRVAGTTPMEMQFSLKRKLYSNEKHGIVATGGVTAYVPLNRWPGDRPVFAGYAIVSKILTQLNGLRVTGGGYQIGTAAADFGTKTGGMFALEQPLTKRFSLLADWSTGRNRYGYAAGGINLMVKKNQAMTLSYNFGNTGAGNNFLAGYYAVTF
jgi:hypothetical protein